MEVANILKFSQKFYEIKANDTKVVEKLNKLTDEEMVSIKQYLEGKSLKKINKIRLLVVSVLLKNHSITRKEIEEIKTEVNNENDTNILNSWKSYFSLFYTFF